MKDLMNVTAHIFGKASGSNSLSHNQSCTKRARHDKTIHSSSFKGVVALMNGNWAARVYVNHNWICKGIFKTEEEADMAYESTTAKLLIDSLDKNLPNTDNIAQEPNFQKQVCIADSLSCRSVNIFEAQRQQDCTRTRLFEKVLNPSDVGRLSRIVIPKIYASCFPCDSHELAFYDQSMTLWNFRYGVCKGSNSHVLSSGWKDFVQAKDLRSADKVIFFKCMHFETWSVVHSSFAVNVEYNANRVQVEEANRVKYVVADGEKSHSKEGVQNFGLEQNHSGNAGTRLEMGIEADHDLNRTDSRKAPENCVMLFGVKIA
ncbi:AP2/ERF and B3 domain-containing transcription factor At1g51120-like [Apium graveolens]|uniref:AP2/ERF and B3 domain-containing transcription factor At1g51120-like n=1 Tax=Apium graveolens TaxID=4045 RepID=UPI003D7995CA